MKGLIRFIATASVFALALPVGAQAATPPRGSYQKSCVVTGGFDGGLLTASCRPENSPNFRSSQIDARSCGEEIFNRDGGLQCYARRGSWGNGRAIPHGSYVDTCKDIFVTGGQSAMNAQCKDRGGNYRFSQISLTGCDRDRGIDNDDGRLVCRR